MQRVVLVGAPNVGKSLVFRRLTGLEVEVANFPGSTVTVTRGALRGQPGATLIDAPGVYGLSRFNAEEAATVAVLGEADLVVNVVDATNLARDLFLTLQLKEIGLPLIVALNFMDEVRRQGWQLDWLALGRRLAVPVLPISAKRGEGMTELIDAVTSALASGRSPSHGLEELLWWEEDAEQVAAVGHPPPPGSREGRYQARRASADRLAAAVLTRRGQESPGRRLGQALLHPVFGALALAAVLLGAYQVVGVWVAGDLVDQLEAWVGRGLLPAVGQALATVLPPQGLSYRLLMGEYGVISAGLTYLVALLLPIAVAFYALLAVLEDCGYLPRLATWLDRAFQALGLNGRAVIPLVLGLGCVTMATVSTRILGSRREQTIASILLAWTIPCSAQIGVISGLLAGIGWHYAVAYGAILTVVFVAVGTAANRLLPGAPSPLLLDLPPLRWPDWRQVVRQTVWRGLAFLREAGALFAVGSGLVQVAHLMGWLGSFERAAGPFLATWLGLPPASAAAFLLGFLRRDFAAAGFYQLGLTPHQILTGVVTLTLFVPCLASTLVLIKERGMTEGVAIWLGSVGLALTTGGLVAHLLPL